MAFFDLPKYQEGFFGRVSSLDTAILNGIRELKMGSFSGVLLFCLLLFGMTSFRSGLAKSNS